MPRILIAGFCALPGPNRAGVQVGHVLRALGREHSVDVLCVRREEQAYVERRGGARILRVPVPDSEPMARVETFRRALRRQLEGADYDAVLVRDGWSGVPALEMREALRYAIIFDAARSPMAQATTGDQDFVQMQARNDDACLREADLILAPTEAARQYFETRSRPERVHVVPLGVDVDLFDWDEPPSDGPQRILCVGTLTPESGVGVLIKSMEVIAARGDVQLMLAGPIDDVFKGNLEREIDALGLADRVTFMGEVEHRRVPDLIASATICVAPGAVELSPRPTTVCPSKILEYMACRRAVVAPRRGTVTLLIRDRQHGLLFNPGDPDSLALQVVRLLEDEEQRESLAAAGYELVRKDHPASATRRALRHAFSWLNAQVPWSERWQDSERTDEAVRVPTDSSSDGGITDSLMFGQTAASSARTEVPFTAEQTLYDAEEGMEPEDHTMVEAPPRRRPSDTREAPIAGSLRTSDDWVVGESGDEPATYTGGAPLSSRFVAGELDSGGEEDELEPSFTAMTPLLSSTPKKHSD